MQIKHPQAVKKSLWEEKLHYHMVKGIIGWSLSEGYTEHVDSFWCFEGVNIILTQLKLLNAYKCLSPPHWPACRSAVTCWNNTSKTLPQCANCWPLKERVVSDGATPLKMELLNTHTHRPAHAPRFVFGCFFKTGSKITKQNFPMNTSLFYF